MATDQEWLAMWQESRATIGRFDQILADLRKYGFTLITGIITGNAILSVVVTNLTDVAKDVVFMVIILLILALFALDHYYQTMLIGAVDTAARIEKARGWPTALTEEIGNRAKADRAGRAVIVLYAVFIFTAGLLSVVTPTDPTKTCLPGPANLALMAAVILLAWGAIVVYRGLGPRGNLSR